MTLENIISIYCLCEDYLKSINLNGKGWPNEKMSNAEVIMTFIVATRFFYGNIERARIMLKSHGYIQNMLSKSRLNRRIHNISDGLWEGIIEYTHKNYGLLWLSKDFIVDSFPVRVCHNIRIKRCKILQGENFRGYNSSKKEYFYGMKITVITDLEGQPIKMNIVPGSEHDLPAFKTLNPCTLPEGSTIYGDAAYIDYAYEDKLGKNNRNLVAERKSNSTKHLRLEDWVNLKAHRKTIETAFSKITGYMAKKIHAVIERGFRLKIINFFIAESTNFLFN